MPGRAYVRPVQAWPARTQLISVAGDRDAPEGFDGVGYLLKARVADISEFIEAISRVTRGGTVFDRRWSGNG